MKQYLLDIYQLIIVTIGMVICYFMVLPKMVSAADTGLNIGALVLGPLGILLYAAYVTRTVQKINKKE